MAADAAPASSGGPGRGGAGGGKGVAAGRVKTKILGVAIPPAVAAGAVAARAALWAGAGRLSRHGAAGLAELVDAPGVFLSELTPAGVTVTAFEGGDPQD